MDYYKKFKPAWERNAIVSTTLKDGTKKSGMVYLLEPDYIGIIPDRLLTHYYSLTSKKQQEFVGRRDSFEYIDFIDIKRASIKAK